MEENKEEEEEQIQAVKAELLKNSDEARKGLGTTRNSLFAGLPFLSVFILVPERSDGYPNFIVGGIFLCFVLSGGMGFFHIYIKRNQWSFFAIKIVGTRNLDAIQKIVRDHHPGEKGMSIRLSLAFGIMAFGFMTAFLFIWV